MNCASGVFLASLLFCWPSSTGQQDYEVLAEWTTVKFEFDSPGDEQAALDSGEYIPENCILTGIKATENASISKYFTVRHQAKLEKIATGSKHFY